MKNFIILILFICCDVFVAHAVSYGVIRSPAPVLNTPVFSTVFGGVDGKTLKTDRCRQVRELEFIALPGTVVTIHATQTDGKNTIFRITTDEYSAPKDSSLYLDSRFVEVREAKPQPRERILPSRTTVIAALQSAVGAPYVWGGNAQGGVSELLELFYGGAVSPRSINNLTLAGLDCSGLLYQATGGLTPRNTSQLIAFGKALRIGGKSADDIAGLLEPLDLIVWSGHVIIVLDKDTTIESRLECGKPGSGGVMLLPLKQRLAEIMRTRQPRDSWPSAGKQRGVFVVRRWFGQ